MSEPEIPTISITDISADTYLLDVREPDEWAAGHAPDAHHIPRGEVPNRLAEVPMQEKIAVICRSGMRSAQVVAYLSRQGWGQVRNVDGGMAAWTAAGRPVIDVKGRPGRII